LIAITGVSISTKIMGIVVVLTLFFGLVMTLQVRLVMTLALQRQLHNQGFAVASDLADRAASLIEANDRDGLDILLRDTVGNQPDSRYAFVLDNERRLLANASRNIEGNVTVGGEIAPEILMADLASPTSQEDHLHYTNAEGRIHDFVVPIVGANGQDELGLVRLALVETRLNELISDVTEQMLLTTLLVAGVGILAAMLLIWLLTRPILDLVTVTQQLREGDLSVRAPHWNDDEIGALSDAFNQMVSELEVSQELVVEKENARTHLLSRLISAQEEERKRIARELHDGVGQALTSILVHIKVLAQSQDPATHARMEELRQLVDHTLADVRLLSRELRPSALDDLGLAAALERYVLEFGVRYPHLSVDLHCVLPHRLPPNVETSLYRVIQEAMTNAARHSHATSLSVVVNERAGAVHAIIEDNGTGFDVESTRRAGSSVGLHSMNERSELLNGTLEIESSGDGTTVYVQIPIGENAKSESYSAATMPPEGDWIID
jgi:signal transduction histidine kinase